MQHTPLGNVGGHRRRQRKKLRDLGDEGIGQDSSNRHDDLPAAQKRAVTVKRT